MKKNMRRGITVICIGLCLSGCGRDTGNIKTEAEPGMETASQAAEQGAETERQAAKPGTTADFFPESYSEQTDKVKFECQLEIPEDFDVSNFHIPSIKGVTHIDYEKAYAKYVEGNTVVEEHHDGQDEKRADAYILEDGTVVYLTDTEEFSYYTPSVSVYSISRTSERGAPKEEFAFATGDACMEQVKKELKEIGCPVEEYQFGWFSTSGEEYAELEQQALEDELLDSRSVNENGWTEADNTYRIYGWQIYEKLPVFPWAMTSLMTRAFESYGKAPVSAIYTEQGMISLSLQYLPCIFEPSEEISEFLPFPEIAEVLVRKYNDLLDDAVYTVTRAKLALRTYYDEQQELAAEPIWYFEVTDGSSMEVVVVNAVTAEEVFLN